MLGHQLCAHIPENKNRTFLNCTLTQHQHFLWNPPWHFNCIPEFSVGIRKGGLSMEQFSRKCPLSRSLSYIFGVFFDLTRQYLPHVLSTRRGHSLWCPKLVLWNCAVSDTLYLSLRKSLFQLESVILMQHSQFNTIKDSCCAPFEGGHPERVNTTLPREDLREDVPLFNVRKAPKEWERNKVNVDIFASGWEGVRIFKIERC